LTGVLTSVVELVHAQQPKEPLTSFQVVRIAAGPRGLEVGGQFRLEQERTTFNRSSDAQVVVHFQWDGTPGVHRLAARWRSPTDGVAISEVEYTARDRRFGAYWTLPISPSTPLGAWSIEATIDGLPSGALNFEITDTEIPAAPTSKTRPSPSELYRRLDSIYLSIDRLASRGDLIDRNGGFVLGPSSVVTAFSAIDAADTLEMATADGRRQAVTAIASWDRRQDWAVISATTQAGPPLPLAPADSANVGDRCYSMESGATGARVLAECAIVGRSSTSGGGDRLIVQFLNGRGIPGAPVLNEFGEVIGLIGGAPSAGFRGFTLFRAGPDQGSPVVPASAIRSATGEDVPVQDLRRRGVLMRAVNRGDNILSGGFARQIQKNPIRPIDQREEFTQGDGQFFVFLTWDPKERLRGTLVLLAYDENNQILTESKPAKVDLRPGNVPFSQWQLSVPKPPGNYRIDVLFEEVPIWRGLFRVTA
jgi:hypothetical protein